MRQWDDLRYFLAVARNESLSGAARELEVNHATVYRRVNGLEDELALRLFERLQSGYALTHEGEALLPFAERIEAEFLSLDRQMTGCDLRLSGTLRVTTVGDLLHHLVMPHLAGFVRQYPGIQLEILTGERFFNLTRREADVAIRPARRPDPLAVGRRVATLAVALYGSRDYLAARPPIREPGDLSAHAIVRGDESLAHLGTEIWLSVHIDETKVVLRTNNLSNQLAAAKAGLGLAALPCALGDVAPELVRVLPVEEDPPTGLWLQYHPDLRGTARVRAFVSFFEEALAADRPLLEGERPAAA